MIETLNIPPIRVTTVVDSVAGNIRVNQPASSVTLDSGTLSTGRALLSSPGTIVDQLTGINPTDLFDATLYAERDRQLAGRDLAVSAAVVAVNSQLLTVWGAAADSPVLPQPVWPELPNSTADYPVDLSPAGTIDHVKPSSRPIDATVADADLYVRDMVLYEALARGSSVLADSPIVRLDPYGTILGTIPVEWSLGEPQTSRTTINVHDRLDVDCFKNPDGFLAFRDNTVGVFVSSVLSWLKNPFESAERLNLSITGFESDVYVHDSSQDTDSTRVFIAEPQLEGRLKLVYDKNLQTVRWYPLASSEIHIPQPQPFISGGASVSGPPGRTITFIPDKPPTQSVGYWHSKALQVNLIPKKLLSVLTLSGAEASGTDLDGLVSGVSLQAHSSAIFDTIGTLPSGTLTVGLTVIPRIYQEFLGCQVNDLTPNEDGYGLFSSSGGLATILNLRLPPDNYQLVVEYTNVDGPAPREFPISISFGSDVVTTSPWRFSVDGSENGDIATAVYNVRSDDLEKDLLIQWAPLDNLSTLAIRSVKFTTTTSQSPYIGLTAKLKDGAVILSESRFEMSARLSRPDVATFDFPVASTITNPGIQVDVESDGLVSLVIDQVQVAKETDLEITPNAKGFESWPDRMLSKAAEILLSQYRQASFSVDRREQDTDDVHIWTRKSMSEWLSDLRSIDGRFDEGFQLAGPCDIGKPALIPLGLTFDVVNERITASLPPAECVPTVQALQAWMLIARPVVAKPGFWTE